MKPIKLPAHDPKLVVFTDGYWDPDATNGMRAQSAQSAILHYRLNRSFDSNEATCAVDLITDILHHLHSLGEDPFAALDKSRGFFESEARGIALQIVG